MRGVADNKKTREFGILYIKLASLRKRAVSLCTHDKFQSPKLFYSLGELLNAGDIEILHENIPNTKTGLAVRLFNLL